MRDPQVPFMTCDPTFIVQELANEGDELGTSCSTAFKQPAAADRGAADIFEVRLTTVQPSFKRLTFALA